MGVTRKPSAARTAAATAITATATRAQRTSFTAAFLSIPYCDRHAGAPEGQFCVTDAHSTGWQLPAERPEVPRLPADPDAIGDEPRGAAADVGRDERFGDVEDVEVVLLADAHQSGAADDILPQRIF